MNTYMNTFDSEYRMNRMQDECLAASKAVKLTNLKNELNPTQCGSAFLVDKKIKMRQKDFTGLTSVKIIIRNKSR